VSEWPFKGVKVYVCVRLCIGVLLLAKCFLKGSLVCVCVCWCCCLPGSALADGEAKRGGGGGTALIFLTDF